ncbi:hypothetical protein [Falsirhodobacter sp. 1013]|uniref:hypothetical protein n=1 Tax=Falsirhodobacter sp. 1013 TaxID=3417566 RepID=UPI003EC01F98
MPFTQKKHVREMDEAVTRAAREARRRASDFADRLDHKAHRKTCRGKAGARLEEAQGCVEDARDFTRRHPLSVVAGAAVAGAVLATVLRRGR